jgi:hypothetical protein
MTTEETNSRLPEIIDYYRANPSVPRPPAVPSGSEVHYHYHAAPPPPPAPRPTVAEKVIPWVYLAVLVMIIGTVCAAILAVIGIILIVVLLGVCVAIGMLAYLVRSMNEGAAVKALADQGRKTR